LSAGQVGGYLRQFLTGIFRVKFKRIVTLVSRTGRGISQATPDKKI
jgi:hypothetical protein